MAALALLSPLERRLRNDGEGAVFTAIGASRTEFAEIGVDPATGHPGKRGTHRHRRAPAPTLGRAVTILDRRLDTIYTPSSRTSKCPSITPRCSRALRTGRGVHTLIGNELVAAEPMRIGNTVPPTRWCSCVASNM